VVVASAGLYMQSLHLIPDNHANIPTLSFLQATEGNRHESKYE